MLYQPRRSIFKFQLKSKSQKQVRKKQTEIVIIAFCVWQ